MSTPRYSTGIPTGVSGSDDDLSRGRQTDRCERGRREMEVASDGTVGTPLSTLRPIPNGTREFFTDTVGQSPSP